MVSAVAQVGSTTNRYQVVTRLAVGGMAEILLVRGSTVTGVERYCVLKRILPERASDSRLVQMFLDEARLATHLQHPNIASVYDVGMLDDSYFYTMEYVHGETVRSLLERALSLQRPLPLACVLTIIAGAAAGLHHAHERNTNDGRPLEIVHRDVSPSNVMVSYEGNVKLVDFGVAKASYREAKTTPGTVQGKIGYLSPEQCRGERVDRRSDLFSLGIVSWEMLTGARLYRRSSDFETMTAITDEIPPSPSTRRPEIPKAVDDIVLRLLRKSVPGRFQTAANVIEAIENASVRAGTTLSTAAVSRMMHDWYGPRPVPWQELERERNSDLPMTLISRPIPEQIADSLMTTLPSPVHEVATQNNPLGPRRTLVPRGSAITLRDGPVTASIEVSASRAGVPVADAPPGVGLPNASPRAPSAEVTGSPGLTRSSGALTMPYGDTAQAPRPVQDAWAPPSTIAPRGDTTPRMNTAVSGTASTELAAAASGGGLVGALRMVRTRSRAAWLPITTTLLVVTTIAVALSRGAGSDASTALSLTGSTPASGPRTAGAPMASPVLAAPTDPTPSSPVVEARPGAARPALADSGARTGTEIGAPIRAADDERGSAGGTQHPPEAPPPVSVAPARAAAQVAAAGPAVVPAADLAADRGLGPASRAPRPSAPRTSRPGRSSLDGIRRAFEAGDYAGVVAVCGALTVTSAIAEHCTRAACQTHSVANARRWLPLNAGTQLQKIADDCEALGNPAIRPVLDCSKDRLDCR